MTKKAPKAPIVCHSVHWKEAREKAGRNMQISPGWKALPCRRCGEPVVVSPPSLDYMLKGAEPWCYDCFGPILVGQNMVGAVPKLEMTDAGMSRLISLLQEEIDRES